RKKGFLLIPEEIQPPQELQWLEACLAELEKPPLALAAPLSRGFVRAVSEPIVNALHLKITRSRKVTSAISARRQEITNKALELGPESLSRNEKRELLADPACIASLHSMVWQLSDANLARKWGIE
ncbi:MAG: glucan biosynthesis glucosyltransferase H, partial [Proteobacteria bacterium]|nr:glucan biosynthesis glucosyltransferase H [Pseudomonadota bacterium]